MNTYLFVRSQAVFEASVKLDGLPVVQADWIDRFLVDLSKPGAHVMTAHLARGPLDYPVGPGLTM